MSRIPANKCAALRRTVFFFALLATVLALAAPAARAEILVYDNDTINHLAKQAALAISPTAVIANSSNFNTLLTSQAWTVVLVDAPNNTPSNGSGKWTPLINYVNGGGRVAMSFWDWNNANGEGDAALPGAFAVTAGAGFSEIGRTLTDTGNTSVFLGVTMPNSSWNENWGIDGNSFTVGGGTVDMAHLSSVAGSVMALGNSGRTIAALIIDEAGPTWLGDGSGVDLWTNMYYQVVPEPGAVTLFGSGLLGLLGLLRLRRRAKR
jgi:hypothetical protein